ncbi:hypothetical protein KBY57_04135 [Cyanobium sp. Aljojuca 7D2]|uniref:hypothetical protein n=1 Tax=Cyanobium sp. Aljojuca 7D2 TaxID=2823698 RepID=UPI0020CC158D|nr:hypothetical protein [Cyanobium sp. Aljojuca 7D2]MCP9890253.1 hypothetical protein [Cyanobium sp. Aljojuca 7D2]
MPSLVQNRSSFLSLENLNKYVCALEDAKFLDQKEICLKLKEIYIDFSSHPSNLLQHDLKGLINYFSDIDHLFYRNVLSKTISEEDHSVYINSIGNFGQLLSLALQQNMNGLCFDTGHCKIENILFIIKGPFDLAHMSFPKSFFYGSSKETLGLVNVKFAFLDARVPNELARIAFDLSSVTTYGKLILLKKLIAKESIGTIIWPSVAQNVSLFLGSRFAKQQVFWSARYRNKLFDTVDKYFFGARPKKQCIQYNGVSWKYGRFFVAEWKGMEIQNSSSKTRDSLDQNWIGFIRRKKSQGWIICATISSERKMQDPRFHECILRLIKSNPHIYYFYTSREKSCPLQCLLLSNGYEARFKKINWMNTMTPILGLFDLILDSFPVGASHALCYALNAGTPFISLYSCNNLQSSLLESLNPLIRERRINPKSIGLVSDAEEYLDYSSKILKKDSPELIDNLLKAQLETIGKCLNNPTGMYHDFASHILA